MFYSDRQVGAGCDGMQRECVQGQLSGPGTVCLFTEAGYFQCVERPRHALEAAAPPGCGHLGRRRLSSPVARHCRVRTPDKTQMNDTDAGVARR